ncbi:MAG: YigZ family protein [Neisseria sp.]|uniref:IMPACT family protein n=1 Tax=Neisseria sp. TaxID=192066 RepID=UPI0026DC3BFC|nr:YigZ family protein [Neisseria sp.]MDO4640623.1 YigZ family protein [Neisseria sp.]
MSVNNYKTLAAPSFGEFKDKGSKFMAFAYPIQTAEDVKEYVKDLRQEHHKARHWCYAYRIGVVGLQFRVNDDGEPSGSAGRPILGQIDSFGLTNVLVVVVRYFGGTLLGVPGLINAYKNAAAESFRQAQIIEKNIEKTVWIICGYPDLSELIRLVKQHQAMVVRQDLQLDCRLTVNIPLENYEQCLSALMDMRMVCVQHQPFV